MGSPATFGVIAHHDARLCEKLSDDIHGVAVEGPLADTPHHRRIHGQGRHHSVDSHTRGTFIEKGRPYGEVHLLYPVGVAEQHRGDNIEIKETPVVGHKQDPPVGSERGRNVSAGDVLEVASGHVDPLTTDRPEKTMGGAFEGGSAVDRVCELKGQALESTEHCELLCRGAQHSGDHRIGRKHPSRGTRGPTVHTGARVRRVVRWVQ